MTNKALAYLWISPIATAFALSSTPALASDGVLEISQACANAVTGCFPGDDQGFPVTISAPGSYRLTSNLDLTQATSDTHAIEVRSSFVSVDLAGFLIEGPASCTGEPIPMCTPAGTGAGVTVDDSQPREAVNVTNGSVAHMAGPGVQVDFQGFVDRIRARENGGHGIATGLSSTVIHSKASRNGGNGVLVGDGSVVNGNTANFNGSRGIAGGSACTVIGNAAHTNALEGISVGASTVVGNATSWNQRNGIASLGAISSNTSTSNERAGIASVGGSAVVGNTVSGNASDGVEIGVDGGLIQSNNISDNGGPAIDAANALTAYRENVFSGNGAIDAQAVDLCANAVDGVVSCP